jgi:hypothetical protein
LDRGSSGNQNGTYGRPGTTITFWIFLLDLNASVQVVAGLDIEYGKKGSRKATLSVWRTHVVMGMS